jgi:hypothetical protein
MIEGVVVSSQQGMLQGGPLWPLLAHIYRDELDKELQKRGLAFRRYADGQLFSGAFAAEGSFPRNDPTGDKTVAGLIRKTQNPYSG